MICIEKFKNGAKIDSPDFRRNHILDPDIFCQKPCPDQDGAIGPAIPEKIGYKYKQTCVALVERLLCSFFLFLKLNG